MKYIQEQHSISEEELSELITIKPINKPVLNPNYQSNENCIPRSQRPEWSPVGMFGKIYVRDNGECIVDELCSAENGIAVPGKDWKVMQRISNNVIRILFIPK